MSNGLVFKMMKNDNLDIEVVESFGQEWKSFSQNNLPEKEHIDQFNDYFNVFPWELISEDSVGFDAGCGSGRWALLFAPKVKILHCIDPSEAIDVARNNLKDLTNCIFHKIDISNLPLTDGSMDFGYSLGVLHHIPDTKKALRDCVIKLKVGAPFLLYLYYSFDNQPSWYRWIWKLTDILRQVIWRLPHKGKLLICGLISFLIYYPLARSARVFEFMGGSIHSWPLSAYRNQSFYFMRTDALDRFGTKLEQRFSKKEIEKMMNESGLKNIKFDENAPFYCAIGIKE
jgi:SAM-dependent methyltransferase